MLEQPFGEMVHVNYWHLYIMLIFNSLTVCTESTLRINEHFIITYLIVK